MLMSFLMYAQKNKNSIINKTFIAKTGSVCEETPDDNPCAGTEIYLVLHFTRKFVSAEEKQISSCGEETTSPIGVFAWKWKKAGKLNIMSNEGTFLQNLSLQYHNGELTGKEINEIKKISKYHFRESIN